MHIRKLRPSLFPFPEEAPLLETGHPCNNNVSDWKYVQILQGIWSEPHFSEYTMQKRRLKFDFLKVLPVRKSVSCTILHLCSESYMSKIIIDCQHCNDKCSSASDFIKFGNEIFVPFKNGFNAALLCCLHITLKRSKEPLAKTVTLKVLVNRPLR